MANKENKCLYVSVHPWNTPLAYSLRHIDSCCPMGFEMRGGFEKYLEKRDARVSFPPFLWGTKLPLIGQVVKRIILALLPWAAWPISGNFVPHENGWKLTLASLFENKCWRGRGSQNKLSKLETLCFVFLNLTKPILNQLWKISTLILWRLPVCPWPSESNRDNRECKF